MLKKTLTGLILSTTIILNLNAETLKSDMDKLASSLASVQSAFLLNNKQASIESLKDLRTNIVHTLGDKKKIVNLLPKHLKYKSGIAVNSGKMINQYINHIDEVYADKSLKHIEAQMEAQEALVNIQKQCYKCHNLVRDWGK